MNSELTNSLLTWVKAFAPSVLWAGFIFVLSSQTSLPGFNVSWTDFTVKKLGHIFVYAVLFLLLHWGLKQTTAKQRSSLAIWQVALIITLFYAISDEIHQTFIPGRYGTIRDLGYDMLGAGIALLKRYNYV